jgi:hypothetical protein
MADEPAERGGQEASHHHLKASATRVFRANGLQLINVRRPTSLVPHRPEDYSRKLGAAASFRVIRSKGTKR